MFSMFDEGYSLIVPKKYRWHDSHKGDINFLQKLNLANMNTLHESLVKLRKPKAPDQQVHEELHSSPSDRLFGTPDEYSQKSDEDEDAEQEQLEEHGQDQAGPTPSTDKAHKIKLKHQKTIETTPQDPDIEPQNLEYLAVKDDYDSITFLTSPTIKGESG